MRINRGDQIAGIDALRLRDYFRRYGDNVNRRTLAREVSLTKGQAQRVLDELLKLKMVELSELQPDKEMLSYETTIQGNALGMAKASKPVKRESAQSVLSELMERVKTVNERQELAYRVESLVVFGSYLSDAKRLNDLDVAVEFNPRSSDEGTWRRLCQASMERAYAAGRRFRNVVEHVGWPQHEVITILKNRSRTLSFCEWKSLFEMEGFRYAVVFGDKERIAGLLKGGQAVDYPKNSSGAIVGDPGSAAH